MTRAASRQPRQPRQNEPRWLLLIHQIPPKPSYFRVKIWRRLQETGAVAIKNSVYVLPKNETSCESFQWIMREINQNKGDASICEAHFIEGLTDPSLEGLFIQARDHDYAQLSDEIRELTRQMPKGDLQDGKKKDLEASVMRFKRRFQEIQEIDFFSASGREATQALLDSLESRLKSKSPGMVNVGSSLVALKELKNRVWVTRRGIHVDRIASAWLIRRFIDPKARFKFVDAKIYRHEPRELRFDMVEGEFTHEGDLCSFEVLIRRTSLRDTALQEIAQIIHELDIGDGKYIRGDTAGIKVLINGICLSNKKDAERLAAGAAALNSLYENFQRKRR